MMLLTISSNTRLTRAVSSLGRPHSLPNWSTRSPRCASSCRRLTNTIERLSGDGAEGPGGASDIKPLQHLGGRFIELLRAAHLFETIEQIVSAQPLFLCTAEIVNHLTTVYHHEAVTQVGPLLHRMRPHQRGQPFAGDDLFAQLDDLVSASRIERCRMFVE